MKMVDMVREENSKFNIVKSPESLADVYIDYSIINKRAIKRCKERSEIKKIDKINFI
ncbi:MAG: hypothetical protein J6J36_03595 [Clostridia bacterium]|nr:hypothetical protein [Clostridia bacterium]